MNEIKNKFKTIRINRSTSEKIDQYKIIPNETYDHVLNRILEKYKDLLIIHMNKNKNEVEKI
jgi:hypothetical protein